MGCLPLTVLVGLLVAVGWVSRDWVSRFAPGTGMANAGDLVSGAQDAFNAGELDRAVDLSRQALINDPENTAAALLLARALVYRSYVDYDRAVDRASALQVSTSMLARDPSNPDVLAVHAFVLQAVGDAAQAARIAEQALNIDAQNGLAHTARALSYARVGGYELALTYSQQAVQVTRGTVWQLDAQRALAISLNDLGRYQEALAAVEIALATNNRLIPLYFEQALYARQLGNIDTATVAYFQVITLDPQNAKARLRLCELSSVLRERDAALRYCGEVITLAPQWADGWYQLGREYFLQGNYPAAQESLHQCTTLQVMQEVPVSERRFECWYLQGQAAEILGDCPALIATYNEFREMAASADISQTWTYPPEGPPGCPATPDS